MQSSGSEQHDSTAPARATALVSFERAAPTAADPEEKLPSVVSRDASETVLEVALGHPKRPGSALETSGRDCPIPRGVGFPSLSVALGALQIPTGVVFPAPGASVQVPTGVAFPDLSRGSSSSSSSSYLRLWVAITRFYCYGSSHSPGLKSGTLERAAPTAADPKEKLPSGGFRRCFGDGSRRRIGEPEAPRECSRDGRAAGFPCRICSNTAGDCVVA